MHRLKRWKYLIRTYLPSIKPPHGNLGYDGFLAYARALPDRQKNMLRRMLACLDMNNIIKQDNKLTYALWTRRDREAARIRKQNRQRFTELGLVRPGDGKHIHHLDGNIRNNRRSNLAVVDGVRHKRAHARSNHVANSTCAQFMRRYRAHERKVRSRSKLKR